MFASIRRYDFRTTPTTTDIVALKNLIEHDFVSRIERLPGFHGYYMCNVDARQLLTISLFDTRASAADSARIAAEFVRDTQMPVTVGPVDLAEGDVLVSREAAREVGTH